MPPLSAGLVADVWNPPFRANITEVVAGSAPKFLPSSGVSGISPDPLTFGDAADRRATVREVLSYGALDAGKTEGATGRARRPPIDPILAKDLAAW